jgi:hypothetical protein
MRADYQSVIGEDDDDDDDRMLSDFEQLTRMHTAWFALMDTLQANA